MLFPDDVMNHDILLADVVIDANFLHSKALLRQLEFTHPFNAAVAGLARLMREMVTHRSNDRRAKPCVHGSKIILSVCCEA